ncbi:transposase [Flavobacterium psychroterrae]|uniref:Transposase n=1 Tax=Flavobacterium psychroterrae TaxID=2133767 RepID=A0ABS5PJI9_9FLAO|nr:transposase [Flavobacterium psychroterrae]MBS7233935.1 transposase [Flavobacterium psychroterrae]
MKVWRKLKLNKNFDSKILDNGDALKQLLARSRYFLHKNKSKWTKNQTQFAGLLFELYPDIQKAYRLIQELTGIFENTKDKMPDFCKINQTA